MAISPLFPPAYTPTAKRTYALHFFLDSLEITRDIVEGRESLGGSESACLCTARALASRGHDVHVHSARLARDMDGQTVDGVSWNDAENGEGRLALGDVDSFCTLRSTRSLSRHVPARHIALWNQDLLINAADVGGMSQVDEMYYVSEYQRRQWQKRVPHLANLASQVVMNPIDLAQVPEPGTVSREEYLIHISRPERGTTR